MVSHEIKGRDGPGFMHRCISVSITLVMREVGEEENGDSGKITQLNDSHAQIRDTQCKTTVVG